MSTTKSIDSVLAGLSQSESVAIVAAFLSCPTPGVDFDKMMALVGAKTAASARERLRVAKKKADQILENAGHEGGSAPVASTVKKTPKKAAPAGGIDKKTPSKVKKGPRKIEAEVKEEADTEDGV
ncbi:hypothetical protein EG327_010589 [Venturia inaequalis]|uniref:Uncharacterized protein n=1 Tax=Venturia inaequalis TaxID=5025 RepID=A0A8H3VQ30_VENIN|nr:hypothetical protein EG327_010589 [Venturia inaequalis]